MLRTPLPSEMIMRSVPALLCSASIVAVVCQLQAAVSRSTLVVGPHASMTERRPFTIVDNELLVDAVVENLESYERRGPNRPAKASTDAKLEPWSWRADLKVLEVLRLSVTESLAGNVDRGTEMLVVGSALESTFASGLDKGDRCVLRLARLEDTGDLEAEFDWKPSAPVYHVVDGLRSRWNVNATAPEQLAPVLTLTDADVLVDARWVPPRLLRKDVVSLFQKPTSERPTYYSSVRLPWESSHADAAVSVSPDTGSAATVSLYRVFVEGGGPSGPTLVNGKPPRRNTLLFSAWQDGQIAWRDGFADSGVARSAHISRAQVVELACSLAGVSILGSADELTYYGPHESYAVLSVAYHPFVFALKLSEERYTAIFARATKARTSKDLSSRPPASRSPWDYLAGRVAHVIPANSRQDDRAWDVFRVR